MTLEGKIEDIDVVDNDEKDFSSLDNIEESIKFNFTDGNTGTDWVFFSLAAKEVGLSDKQFERNCDKYGLGRVKMKSAHVDNRNRNYISREDLNKYKQIKEQEEYERSISKSSKPSDLANVNNKHFSSILNIEKQLAEIVTDKKALLTIVNDIHAVCVENNELSDKHIKLMEQKESLEKDFIKTQMKADRWKKRGIFYIVLVFLIVGGCTFLFIKFDEFFKTQEVARAKLLDEKTALIKSYEESKRINAENKIVIDSKDQIISEQQNHLTTKEQLINVLDKEVVELKEKITAAAEVEDESVDPVGNKNLKKR